jgi:hypothetical protein
LRSDGDLRGRRRAPQVITRARNAHPLSGTRYRRRVSALWDPRFSDCPRGGAGSRGSFNSAIAAARHRPAALPAGFGIDVVADLPGVGTNLRITTPRVWWRSTKPWTLNDIGSLPKSVAAAAAFAFCARASGHAPGQSYATGFIRADPRLRRHPDQHHALQLRQAGDKLHGFPGLRWRRLLRPESRGSVLDPERRARCSRLAIAQYLSSEKLRGSGGVKAAQRLMNRRNALRPGARTSGTFGKSDDDLMEYLRMRSGRLPPGRHLHDG